MTYETDMLYDESTGEPTYRSQAWEQDQQHAGPDWGLVVTGGLLTLTGTYLLYQGMRGNSPLPALGGSRSSQGIQVRESVTINRPAEELYRYWRNFENLPEVMRHLERVTDQGGGRSHWVAKGPAGTKVEWDAELTQEVENALIGWRSVGDSSVPNEGTVRFKPAPGGRGTEIHVSLSYHPPLGALGANVAKLFGEEPSLQIAEDLRRYKQRLETGEIATTEGQPSGRDL